VIGIFGLGQVIVSVLVGEFEKMLWKVFGCIIF
jgi:hypothetical protein